MWRLDRRLTAKERRKLYRRDNRFELLLGILAFVAGITFFVDPAASAGTAAHKALPGVLIGVWEAMYLLGGFGVAVGVARARLLLEVPGLWLLSTALVVNAVAIVTFRGPLMAAAALGPLIAAAWACLGRALDLHRNVHAIKRLDDRERVERRTGESGTLAIAPIALVWLLAAVDATTAIVAVATAVLSGGLGAAVVSFFRLWKESPGIREQATARRVEYLGKIVDRLEGENKRLGERVEAAEERAAYLQQQNELQQDEIDGLRDQIGVLRAQLA